MKNKVGVLLSFGVFIILAGAGCAANKVPAVDVSQQEVGTEQTSAETKSDSNNTQGEAKTSPEVTTGRSMLAMAEVAKHNVKDDCYIVVRDEVYDVTKFVDQHPGGSDKIIRLCGKDATSAFTGQHDGQPQPEAALAGMKIGHLQK